MTVSSGGNFGIGTTTGLNSKVTLYSNCNALTAMEIRDTGTTGGYLIVFYNSSSNIAGGIIHNGTTTVNYSTSSDYRMKENIAPMTSALSKVALLNPVTYKWKEEFGGESGQGFIAHELQAVVPEAVAGAKDAVDADGKPVYQGIDTSFLVATLTAAIKELKSINDQQAETINALTARIEALENR
ncbi:tail fiber domain-containing protein [bacterium]|nr:tail fiber domain-containing protein [bacterium]